MEEGQPSRTAVFAAMARAAHLIIDDEPKIHRDDLALGFSGMQNEVELRAAFQALQTQMEQLTTPEFAKAFWQSYRGAAVMRQRYTEDELEKALELLAAEIEKTRRRVNALEYILIPSIDETIKFINLKLSEMERGDLTRLMRVKEIVRGK